MKEDLEAYDKLGLRLRVNINKAISSNLDKINNVAVGAVRVEKNYQCYYSEQTLIDLFEKNGFKIETTMLISNNGHLFHGKDKFGNATRVGIIITKTNT